MKQIPYDIIGITLSRLKNGQKLVETRVPHVSWEAIEIGVSRGIEPNKAKKQMEWIASNKWTSKINIWNLEQ